jgi:hypothetical protein
MPAIVAAAAISAAASASASAYGAHKTSGAARKSAELQAASANQAGALEAKAAEDALTFAKEQEAQRKLEFQQTQALNLDQYRQSQARLEPYRRLGAGTIGQMAQPIPDWQARPGSLGQMMTGAR